ncbi:MAG: FAD-binding oxidoreductase [Pseudomonadales bacterium]
MPEQELLDKLVALLGADNVLVDEASCRLYAQDVFTRSLPAGLVIRPYDTASLAAAVATITTAGVAVIARGGGMSYTGGYVPQEEGSVIIDTSAMSQVLEVNAEDMYVTVQAGCSWKALHDVLKPQGLRTPFWGPLSGIHATVGGSISQSSVFWGAGAFGSSSDSVISMDVVLANGSVLSTGSAAQRNASPFFRHFGPDLTGLFTCDTGALGVKASVTLRLMQEFKSIRHVSWDYENYRDQVAAISEVARRGLVAQMFGTDPGLGQIRAKRDSLLNDIKSLGGVLKAQPTVMGAIKQGAKIALAGRGVIKNASYPVHANIEERSDAAAEAAEAELYAVLASFGGKKIDNSVPAILRANPFNPLNNMVGPDGERWVPVHGLLPHSRVIEAIEGTERIFSKYQADIDRHNISTGFLTTTASTNSFFLEPLWLWPDELNELHEATVEKEVLSRQKGFSANLEARQAVTSMREEIVQMFSDMGASHLQIGKEYHYKQGLKPEAYGTIKAIKDVLDPHNRINPGSLGFQ